MNILKKYENTSFYSIIFLTFLYTLTWLSLESSFQGINSKNSVGVFIGIIGVIANFYVHFIGLRKYIVERWKNLFENK